MMERVSAVFNSHSFAASADVPTAVPGAARQLSNQRTTEAKLATLTMQETKPIGRTA